MDRIKCSRNGQFLCMHKMWSFRNSSILLRQRMHFTQCKQAISRIIVYAEFSQETFLSYLQLRWISIRLYIVATLLSHSLQIELYLGNVQETANTFIVSSADPSLRRRLQSPCYHLFCFAGGSGYFISFAPLIFV